MLSVLLLALQVSAFFWGDKPKRTEFKLPASYIPFDLTSKYAVLAYCKPLYDYPNGNYTLYSLVDTKCASMTEEDAKNTLVLMAHTDPETQHRCAITMNKSLKTIFLSCKGMQAQKEVWNSIQIMQQAIFYTMEELTYTRANTKGMKIHQGFKRMWKNMRPYLIPKLQELVKQYPDYNILFSGHSLGAATSLLFAIDYYDVTGDASRIRVFTFGQTRTGNSVWARYVNSLPFSKNIFRMTVRGDPVPHLPFNFMDYEHIAQNYQVVPEENYKVYTCDNNPGTGESQQCLDDILNIHWGTHSTYWYIQYDDRV